MSFTPEQIAKIRKKAEQMPDALKRDANVNYYEGWFFVTLNTRDGVPVLCTCEGDVHIADGVPGAPHCAYTEVGKGVIEAWHKMQVVCKTVKIDLCEAMPEHFHGLVHLLPGNKRHLGSLISGFMSGSTHAYWDTLGIDWHADRYDKGAYALKNDRDRDHTHSLRGPALFVHGYNDMEPITEEEAEIKREYIRQQARKRLIQGDRHECFRKYRHQHSVNWTEERAMAAVCNDMTLRNNDARHPDALSYAEAHQAVTLQNVKARLNMDEKGVCLDYIGNRALLGAERKLPLICHRADSHLFLTQKAAVLQAAREGAVVVSAFISPKERDIMKQLMQEQLPFIEVLDNGIAEKYKGVGKAFYAFAEKRLCQITPWNYQYQKEVKVSREMCMVMNELVRVISGAQDDWWKDSLREM